MQCYILSIYVYLFYLYYCEYGKYAQIKCIRQNTVNMPKSSYDEGQNVLYISHTAS
jgi:hypothetical protein